MVWTYEERYGVVSGVFRSVDSGSSRKVLRVGLYDRMTVGLQMIREDHLKSLGKTTHSLPLPLDWLRAS